MAEETRRLNEAAARTENWRRWGPYLAERQWGTMREDYSENGDAWGCHQTGWTALVATILRDFHATTRDSENAGRLQNGLAPSGPNEDRLAPVGRH